MVRSTRKWASGWAGAFGGAVAALLLAAPGALAAEPTIDKLDPEELLPGGVLKIAGLNYSDVVADCVVTIGGERATVLSATLELLTVFVPQALKAGKHDVIVKVGKETSAKKSVTILEDNAENRDLVKSRELAEHESVGSEVGALQTDFITLDPPRTEQRRGELYIIASGLAQYPDNCVIFLSLKLDKRFAASGKATVEGGRFTGELGPFRRALFAGNYAVEAEFRLHNQPGRIRRLFNKAFTDAKDRSARMVALDRQYVRIGTVEDERDHLAKMRQHYETMLRESNRAYHELEDRFYATVRSAFRAPSGEVKELEWEDWLKTRLARGLGEEALRDKARELAAIKLHLTGKNVFEPTSWREWIDYKWRADMVDLARRHQEFRDSWEIMRHPDAVRDMEEALGVLVRLSQKRSQELYHRNGMPLHTNDETLAGAEAGAGLIKVTPGVISPWRFEELAKQVGKEVGIQ